MFWSTHLAQTYLTDLPDGKLLADWSGESSPGEAARVRGELQDLSREDSLVRGWIVDAWRDTHRKLVHRTERLSPEELARQPGPWFLGHGPRNVLLAVLSEATEDTARDVQQLLANLPGGRVKSRLRAQWEALQNTEVDHEPSCIALIGGHSSEAARIRDLGRRHGVRFKWTAADKAKGLASIHAGFEDCGPPRAVIVVTGNVAHSTMHVAKRFAERLAVPCRFVQRITARTLGECLLDLAQEQPG